MRLWTLHPKYLDPQGLVALWREALLAKAVLRGETRGYQKHPQLARFRSAKDPLIAIDIYIAAVFDESLVRGYSFNESKFERLSGVRHIAVMSGQIEFEWRHLMHKLSSRSPLSIGKCDLNTIPDLHPLFRIIPGPIEAWERGQDRP